MSVIDSNTTTSIFIGYIHSSCLHQLICGCNFQSVGFWYLCCNLSEVLIQINREVDDENKAKWDFIWVTEVGGWTWTYFRWLVSWRIIAIVWYLYKNIGEKRWWRWAVVVTGGGGKGLAVRSDEMNLNVWGWVWVWDGGKLGGSFTHLSIYLIIKH